MYSGRQLMQEPKLHCCIACLVAQILKSWQEDQNENLGEVNLVASFAHHLR